jgi:hypothetical protein
MFYYEPVGAAACHDFPHNTYPSFWDHHAKFMQNETLEAQPFFGGVRAQSQSSWFKSNVTTTKPPIT